MVKVADSAIQAVNDATAAMRYATLRIRSATRLVERDELVHPIPARVVVLLHDTDSVRMPLAQWLGDRLNVPVAECRTSEEARAACEKYRPAVLIADYDLGNGETSATLLATRDPRVRAILMTGIMEPRILHRIARGVGSEIPVIATPTDETQLEALALRISLILDDEH